MSRNPIVRVWDDHVIADNFAGGGGASTGIELALGRSPDIAVNHDPEAIAMHAANHPDTKHYIESVWKVDPRKATGGKPVKLAWFSPDCKHFSKAKGGKPREQKIRGLAWVANSWATRADVETLIVENVEEFVTWGPLYRDHTGGCDARCLLPGKKGDLWRGRCQYGCPIKERAGEIFRAFVRKLRRRFVHVEWKVLRACDFGAPTTRKRFFLIASRNPIRWPAPTHGPGRARPHRTAAECIDWSIPCPSIFDRERPLADKTMARIARGVVKYVLESGRPFIVPVNHGGYDKDGERRRDHRIHDIDAPMPTITGGQRGSHAIAVPYLVHRSNGERVGQAPRIYDPQRPLGTIVAQGQKHALCTAFLAKHNAGGSGQGSTGQGLEEPMHTLVASGNKSVVAAHLVRYNTENSDGSARGQDVRSPMSTLDTANRIGVVETTLAPCEDDVTPRAHQVAAFLVRYNRTGDAEPILRPLPTLTTKERFGLVTVAIDGETYVVVDIGMRMLTPAELYAAQGFPPDYKIAPVGPRGKAITKTAQIRMVGNSVCPPVAAAIVRSQVVRDADANDFDPGTTGQLDLRLSA